MRIAICIPTRGAIMTETVEAVQANINYAQAFYNIDTPAIWFTSHRRPIPEGHLWCLERAMDWDFDAVWFVEEDVAPPFAALSKMLEAVLVGMADLAFVDYPMQGADPAVPNCFHRNPLGKVTWTGMGCTLITKRAFSLVPEPWFRVDQVAEWVAKGSEHESIRWKRGIAAYGGFDIWFGWHLHKAGGRLEVVEVEGCRHVKLRELGQRETQDGLHILEDVGPVEFPYYSDGTVTELGKASGLDNMEIPFAKP